MDNVITNYQEITAGVLNTCHGVGNMNLARGILYEPHTISQGAEQNEQYVLLQEPPEVIYAPSTVVNHNGMNMEDKFSSYKWKVPCFRSNITQRCVLRMRSHNRYILLLHKKECFRLPAFTFLPSDPLFVFLPTKNSDN